MQKYINLFMSEVKIVTSVTMCRWPIWVIMN